MVYWKWPVIYANEFFLIKFRMLLWNKRTHTQKTHKHTLASQTACAFGMWRGPQWFRKRKKKKKSGKTIGWAGFGSKFIWTIICCSLAICILCTMYTYLLSMEWIWMFIKYKRKMQFDKNNMNRKNYANWNNGNLFFFLKRFFQHNVKSNEKMSINGKEKKNAIFRIYWLCIEWLKHLFVNLMSVKSNDIHSSIDGWMCKRSN